jgi:hypothetical protein
VKELTVTSFGLIIAYLLPGLVGLYGLSFAAHTSDFERRSKHGRDTFAAKPTIAIAGPPDQMSVKEAPGVHAGPDAGSGQASRAQRTRAGIPAN